MTFHYKQEEGIKPLTSLRKSNSFLPLFPSSTGTWTTWTLSKDWWGACYLFFVTQIILWEHESTCRWCFSRPLPVSVRVWKGCVGSSFWRKELTLLLPATLVKEKFLTVFTEQAMQNVCFKWGFLTFGGSALPAQRSLLKSWAWEFR